MEDKPKKPKVKKPRKPRVGQKQKQTQIVTVNVLTQDKPKPKRKPRAKPKPKTAPPSASFGLPSTFGGAGGLTAGQPFRQVIYAPSQDVRSSIQSLEKSIATLSQENPRLPPGAPAILPVAPPNAPLLGAAQPPASPLAPQLPMPSVLAPSTSVESQSPSIFGPEMSLAGDAINDPPIDPLSTEDEAADMFMSELAKQSADQSRVIAGLKQPSLDDLMKSIPIARGESDVSTLTADEGGAEEPPKPATASPRKPRGPNKTAEQKAQEKAEKDAAKQKKEDERTAALAAKVRGGGGGVIRMGFN